MIRCSPVRQAFAGYKRLAAGDAPTPWWEVLGIDRQAPPVAVKQAYKELAKLHHPDRGDREPGTVPGHQQGVAGVPENAGVLTRARGPQAGDVGLRQKILGS